MSGGEDGSETPSASETPPAPESPEAETPAAPQEPVERADEGRAESRRPRLLPVWILLGAAALGGRRLGGDRAGGGREEGRLLTRLRCRSSPLQRSPGRCALTIRAG